MAEKTFASPTGAVNDAAIQADWQDAKLFDKLKVGKCGLYFRDGFKQKFVPYSYIDRAFIRVQEVNGRMCCGTAKFAYFRFVLVHDGKEFADVISEKEAEMDAALALVHELAPEVKIGVEKK